MERPRVTVDGNEATAWVAYKASEVIAIYPITPASPMGELADEWSTRGEPNAWGLVPRVVEMQSEGGAAGAVHGSLQAGALTTTFTASQGLLLMMPNMFKIAGELNSTVFHIACRSVATHALSIFGDHSDVMAVRSTGWAILFSASVQEAQDLALVAHASTLRARVPFLHCIDGFRTSHEINKIERLLEEDIRALLPEERIRAHRERALSPDRPFIRGTAQNPDVFFQARERANPYYLAVPTIVQEVMDRLAERVGRAYRLFEYVGHPEAERVLVMMGSACETAEETVRYLADRGERVGLVKVRLFRPFSVPHFLEALPPTVRVLAVLDRTKEPGALGEPLYLDVCAAVMEGWQAGKAPFGRPPRVLGGRYGLASKELTPGMLKGLLDEMAGEAPRNHFTLGIVDDVTHTGIPEDPDFHIEPPDVVRAVFYGLGADGTVSANKNAVKVIGEGTPLYAQAYFVYDSKKAGSRTVSHLRFGPRPIRSTYRVQKASFVGVNRFDFLERYRHLLDVAEEGAILLLNAPFPPEEVWDRLPRSVQETILRKGLKVYAVDAARVGRESGLGGQIGTVMQTCFFALTGVLPLEEAVRRIKDLILKTYGKRGPAVVKRNFAAVDMALERLRPVPVPGRVTAERDIPPIVPEEAPAFVREVIAPLLEEQGDRLPVSALPPDGTFPSGTARWERRNIAEEVPVWEPDLCIQCGKCVLVCPHATLRAKVVREEDLAGAPEGFLHAEARWRELPGYRYTLQVAVEDCTGCALCVEVCPARDKSQVGRKALNMHPQRPLREPGRRWWDFFLALPDLPRRGSLPLTAVKNVQLLEPLFEFSGACAGCGETPYLKLLSQLFGDRILIANATGCSSIYGGNLPTTPWTHNREGRGPAWSNSLFEDNAEFGLGMRLALDLQEGYARHLLRALREEVGPELADAILEARPSDEEGIRAQRERVETLKRRLRGLRGSPARDLLAVADALVPKSVWIVGGDGWAYDIGYGGLDHVLASGANVKVLVLDTEVYSNTGGQASKATPLGAVAKFAAAGKDRPKKDLGLMAMTYGNVYVASVAMGANDTHTVRAFLEAEAYPGPALILAYSHCIAHGVEMRLGMHQQRRAVESGYWLLYRYNPLLRAEGKNPLQLDCPPPRIPLRDYLLTETRFRMLALAYPERAEELLESAQQAVRERWERYQRLARHGF